MRITNTVQDIFEEMRTAWAIYLKDNFSRLRNPAQSLGDELKIMLGRGEISTEQYQQLKWKLFRGSLGRGDLELLRRQARNRLLIQDGEVTPPQDPSIAAGLDRLYIRIASLQDAKRQAEIALKKLEVDFERVKDLAHSAEEMARKTLPDETEARSLLEIRQNMLERLQVLDDRKHSLSQGIRRLEVLQGELYAYEAELKVLEAQAGIAGMEYSGWEGLLGQNALGMRDRPYGHEEIEFHGGNK